MDKNTQNLDPALKATYERVMGTNVAAPTPTPAPTLTPTSTPSPSPAPQPAVTVPQGSNDTKVVAGGRSRKSGKLSPVLLVIAILLFFSIYTFVWLFVFKVKIPFIPKLF